MNQQLVPCPDQCGSFTTAEHAEQIRAAMAALHRMETEVEDIEQEIKPAVEQEDATGPEPVADVPAEPVQDAEPEDPFARSRVIRLGPAW